MLYDFMSIMDTNVVYIIYTPHILYYYVYYTIYIDTFIILLKLCASVFSTKTKFKHIDNDRI